MNKCKAESSKSLVELFIIQPKYLLLRELKRIMLPSVALVPVYPSTLPNSTRICTYVGLVVSRPIRAKRQESQIPKSTSDGKQFLRQRLHVLHKIL